MSFLLLLISFSALFSQYDWEDNGLPLRQGVHIEWQRTGDIGGSQDMIFAWSDTRYGGRDVYVQKVDALGNQLWGSEGTPVVIAPGRQEDPILVTDGNEPSSFKDWQGRYGFRWQWRCFCYLERSIS